MATGEKLTNVVCLSGRCGSHPPFKHAPIATIHDESRPTTARTEDALLLEFKGLCDKAKDAVVAVVVWQNEHADLLKKHGITPQPIPNLNSN